MAINFLIVGAARSGTTLLASLLDLHPKIIVEDETYQGILRGSPERFIETCNQEASKYPNKLWGHKLVIWCLREAKNHFLFNELIPSVKVILNVRDGRTLVRSKMRWEDASMPRACEAYKRFAKFYKFFRDEHKNNIFVRFEDVLGDTENTLKSICQFLEVEYSSAMIDNFANSRIMKSSYFYKTIDRSRLNPDDIPEGCEELIEEELRLCGYIR